MRLVEQRLREETLALFGGSLAIRHVDAGSCNGRELEIHITGRKCPSRLLTASSDDADEVPLRSGPASVAYDARARTC